MSICRGPEEEKNNLPKTATTKKKKWKKIPTTPSNYIPLPSAHCFLFGVNGFRVRRTQYTYIYIYYLYVLCTYVWCIRLYIHTWCTGRRDGERQRRRRKKVRERQRGHGENELKPPIAFRTIHTHTHTYIYVHV